MEGMSESADGDPPPKPTITRLTSAAELDAFIAEPSVALVEFYTDGCGICQSMEPVVSNLAREVSIPIGTVNPRDDPPLIDRFEVRSVPLFVLFVDGEPTARRAEGFISGDDLTDWIESHQNS